MRLVLADAGVRAQRSRDRHVPGELRQQPGVDRLVVGHVAEADPRVEHRGSDRRVGITGVGVVDDAQVAAGDRHVVRLDSYGPATSGAGSAWRITSGAVTSRSTVPAAQVRPPCVARTPRAVNVRPLEMVSSSIAYGAPASAARVKTIDADTARRPGAWRPAATIAWPEHLAALDDGTAPVAAGGADVAGLAVRSDVEHVDQVGGVAPGGEALGGDVPLVVAGPGVDEHQVDPLVIEGDVAGQVVLARLPGVVLEPVEGVRRDVGPGEPEPRRPTGMVAADRGSRTRR